jgi:IS5 family transposase
MGHVVMENRSRLVVVATTTLATGTAEREAAEAMVGEPPAGGRITLGADKAYDTADFVAGMRQLDVTPHVARNDKCRRSAIDRRTTRHGGYTVSPRVRKRIEAVFGWMKTVGGQRKTRYRGTARVGWMFTLSAAAYNLIRMPKLLAGAA